MQSLQRDAGQPEAGQREARYYVRLVAIFATILFACSISNAQNAHNGQQPQMAWAEELKKYPGIQDEFVKLFEKAQHGIQYPAPRSESRLMPLLPPSTMFYAAIPNYGQASDQALKILRQELQESPVFRDWWQHGEMASAGPKIEDAVEKFSQLNSYLGDEIVISGTVEAKEPNFQMVAEIRKPGLKRYLQQILPLVAGNSKPPLRVLDQQELATAKETGPSPQPAILVRPDYVVLASNLAGLRSFSARLDQGGHEFVSTPFAQRVAREYQGGVTFLAAADMQRVLNMAPPATRQDVAFQQSGFADMKYLVWDHKIVAGKAVSRFEMSFNGPRHGAASWLAKSSPLGTLDFVSPGAIMAVTLVLTNPALIFDDVKGLASISNPQAFAALPVLEQGLHLSLRDDLLGLLRGEITVEVDSASPQQPAWRAILAVKNTDRLQQTLDTVMTAAHLVARSSEEGGVTYNVVRIPTPKAVVPIAYAFVDGYWILGSSRDAVAEGVGLHRSGGSLAKSKKLLASLPPGQTLNASGMFYQDPVAMAAMQLRQSMPSVAASLLQNRKDTSPAAVWLYGEESAIREVSTNSTFDAGAVLVGAAIAIPNLLRSKIAANETAAVTSLRIVNTAEVTYAATYPQRGFAPNLDVLGPDPGGRANASADHAGLIDASENCSPDGWCTSDGYRFKMIASCRQRVCGGYAVFAEPVSSNTGTRSFCSTSDRVIRARAEPGWNGPLTALECKAWPPIQ